MLIDTHAHVYATEFESEYNRVMETAIEAGVSKIYMPNVCANTIEPMLRLHSNYPNVCIPQIGLHPCHVKEDYKNELSLIKAHITQNHPYAAIGEIGLDLYWDKTFYTQQVEAFHAQIEWALTYHLPIVIHSRNATQEAIEIVKQYKNKKITGVFHCFSGTVEQALETAELGFYIGIGGVLTFKNGGLNEIVTRIPISTVVLETDAPYLAPVPHRGKTNQPAFLPIIAQKLADILHMNIGEISTITTQNALNLYKHSL